MPIPSIAPSPLDTLDESAPEGLFADTGVRHRVPPKRNARSKPRPSARASRGPSVTKPKRTKSASAEAPVVSAPSAASPIPPRRALGSKVLAAPFLPQSPREQTRQAIADTLTRARPCDVHGMIERAAHASIHFLRSAGECSLDQHVRACGLVSVAHELAVSLGEQVDAETMRRAADALTLFAHEAAKGRAFAIGFAARVADTMLRASTEQHDVHYWRVVAAELLIAIEEIETMCGDDTHSVRECFLSGLDLASSEIARVA